MSVAQRQAAQPISGFDLLREVKEMQLQHGLRADDFQRYHSYLTRKLHTLRGQLGLANKKKQFVNKQVTPQITTDARHLLLLAIEAERCWAAAEEDRLKAADSHAQDKKDSPPVTELMHHLRNRLNKAVKWSSRLTEVVDAVGSDSQKLAAKGYSAELKGKCALSHVDYERAKAAFQEARQHYYGMRHQCDSQQWSVVVAKIRECDDRVIFAMQRLGQDHHSYNPPLDEGEGQGVDAAQVSWLGQSLTVYSVKVKEVLRSAKEIEVQRNEFESTRDCLAATNAQSKLLDYYDREIGAVNDAISHTQQDLRDNVGDRTQLQLLEHFLRFKLHQLTLSRTKFLINVYVRRYQLTAAALAKGGPLPPPVAAGGSKDTTSSWTQSTAASPHEVVHLYDQAIECIIKMQVLPGVDDHPTVSKDVDDELSLAQAGRLLYLGEGWLIVGSPAKALASFKQVEKRVATVSAANAARAKALLDSARTSVTRLAALRHLKPDVGNSNSVVLSELTKSSGFQFCDKYVRLPPDFQSVPNKPVFVDIASTFVEMPSMVAPHKSSQQAPTTTSAKETPKQATASSSPSKTDESDSKGEGKAGWFSGWGWGKKK